MNKNLQNKTIPRIFSKLSLTQNYTFYIKWIVLILIKEIIMQFWEFLEM